MSKEYVFEFPGTKEEFLNTLNQYGHNPAYPNGTSYYINDYIVRIVDEEICFGVKRGGHSGGYWFIPTITNNDDGIEFHGTIQYIGPGTKDESTLRKIIDGIELILILILTLPIVLVFQGYKFIKRLVRKLFNRPEQKEKTNEELLFDLMENHMGCVSK